MNPPSDLQNRIAVVTGASRGIGRAIALELARRGAHVVAAARTVGALEELDDEIKAEGGAATLVPVDMKDMEALDRLGAAINERWGKLDIFVGNAGLLGSLSPLGHFTPKQWDEVMAVNVTANWRLIRSLDPLLRQSDAGRVVMISSGIVKFCHAYWGLYASSKAALEAMTRCYAAETAESTRVRAMIVRPGPLRTRMRAAAMPGEDPMTLKTPEDIAPKIAALCAPSSNATNAIYDFPTDSIRGFD